MDEAIYMRDKVLPAMADGPRGRRRAGADRGRRPLAAAEVLGDALHPVGRPDRHAARTTAPAPAPSTRGRGRGRSGGGSLFPRHARPDRKEQPVTNEEVVTAVEERDVRFIRLWFTDILGQLKSFSITRDEVGSALEHGMGFDGSSITGFNAIEESDMVAMPDPSTFAILPYRPRERAVARMFCDIRLPGGEPYEGDPRLRAAAGPRPRGVDGLRPLLPQPGARVLLLPQLRRPRRARPRRLLRPDHARRRQRPAPRHRDGARGDRDRDRVLAPRGRAPPSTRSTCATTTRCAWPTTS